MRSGSSRVPSVFIIRWVIAIGIGISIAAIYWTYFRSSVDDIGILPADLLRSVEGGKRSGRHDTQKEDVDESASNDETSYEKIETIESFAESNCPRWNEDTINVHFILHSHDDPGWLKTPQQYFDEDVHKILNAVIEQLAMEPHRKFVYSEMYFFSKWWNAVNNSMRHIVKRLIQRGQLEFVGGGWVQSDDACTHYTAAIDQLTYGWSKINDYFGQSALPKTGWHVDNFGYSQEQAHIFHQMGMEEDVIVRLHHLDIAKRRKTKTMEFLWQSSPNTELFTHVLFDHYTSPGGFQFEPGDHYNSVTDENEEMKAQELLEIVNTRIKSYQTNHLLFIVGNDFAFKNASHWFEATDRLIRRGNSKQMNGSAVQLFYSTPSCYFKAVREAALHRRLTWPRYDGDFYPYATNANSYWTGYFSSRTPLKRNIRIANNLLLTAQNLAATVSTRWMEANLNSSRELLYTTLHHDGITGTCKQKVADQYARLAMQSASISRNVINTVLPALAGMMSNATFQFCPLINVSICPVATGSDEVSLVAINGHSYERSSFIRVPVDDRVKYEVKDMEGNIVPHQMLPVTDEAKQIVLHGRSNVELGFFASLPALGFATFKMRRLSQGEYDSKASDRTDKTTADASIENEFLKLEFDRSGKLAFIIDKKDGKKTRMVQDFFWYSNKDSGAYILRSDVLNNVTNDEIQVERIEKGPLLQEVKQVFARWLTQIIRLYKDKPYVEFEWTVGPLDLDVGREIITRFSTDMHTGRTFYTDANGRRLMKRRRDAMDSMYPFAASFYPITTTAALRDRTTQVSLITDRSLGAASTASGSLELIIYRKVLFDDWAGMGEGLDERDGVNSSRGIVVRGKIWLAIGPKDQMDSQWRSLAKEMFYEPILAFTPSPLPSSWPNRVSILGRPLPAHIHLLTLQRLTKESCLIRFEDFHSTEENAVSFQFRDLFHGLDLVRCQSTQLSGWNKNTKLARVGFIATLRPMEITSYRCQCKSTITLDPVIF